MKHQNDPDVGTWEGLERDNRRRWSALTLDEILEVQEEMLQLAMELAPPGTAPRAEGDLLPQT